MGAGRGKLDEAYCRRPIKVVERQIALAGLRLAKLLNGDDWENDTEGLPVAITDLNALA